MWLASAFLMLGFLVGNLVGLSSAKITHTLLGLLFAFGGGSAIAFMRKLDETTRGLAARAIFALSLGCLAGVYAGILVSEHQWLTPASVRSVAGAPRPPEAKRYLRGEVVTEAHAIDQRLTNGRIELREAYRQLYDLVVEGGREGGRP